TYRREYSPTCSGIPETLSWQRFLESQLKVYAGWTGDSRMPATYVHLSGSDVEPALFAAYGVGKNDRDEMKERLPRKCPRCAEPCAYVEELCHRCGMALTVQAAMKAGEAGIEALVKRLEELERFVRTSQVKTALENTILAAVAQGRIAANSRIDLSRLTEDERVALREFMTLYAVARQA
ncbi:MAG: hypothetical protein ACRDF4_07405, partial [Rhabdochlamydiaceae bacterium]